jgi:glycosyltransferase involved in cell wall biosynthesis
MKVCIVALNIVPLFAGDRDGLFGGAEVQASFVASALAACRQPVSMVVSGLTDPSIIPYPVENAFQPLEGIGGLRFFHPRWTGIMDALERADADVYYQHCAGMVTGLTAMFCRRHRRVFVYGAGSDTDFSLRRVIITGWRDRLLYMYGLRRADGIVAQNEQQATACRAALGREPRVIPTGVALTDGSRDGATKEPVVVWVGGLRDVKQPAVFLDLARRLPHVRFVMVGGPVDSDRQYAVKIRDDARSIPNLTLTGHVPQGEVVRILESASVLVNTSRFEGFPNAFLEAWAAGVPIVSLVDVDGILTREGIGVVCEGVESLAREVGGLMGDPARLGDMGRRARALVKQRYGAGVLGPQYLKYFEELLAARS